MYLEHFQLKELPFGLTPDTQFFCQLATHQEALNVLLFALNNGEGFIKITGNVGTGKSLLCRKLLNELARPFITAYIPNPNLTPKGLRLAVAEELGINYKPQSGLLNQINRHLIETAAKGQKPVLIIDEAQAMSIETLEALRLINNLETEKQKLLQIVLFGQPELDEQLNKPCIRQLRQRITFSYCLKPLSRDDVKQYVSHRLVTAGQTQPIFSKYALLALRYHSQGIPRLINILSHKAMLSAFGSGRQKIALKHIQLAAIDTEASKNQWLVFGQRKAFLSLLLLASAVLFWLKLELNL